MSTILWVSILAAILAAGGHTEQENTNKQHVSSFNIGGLTSFIGSTRENGINIAATYAVQRSKTENDYHGNTLTPSTIDAGGKVYLQAQGAGAESDINITGSDVAGKMGTHLKAEHQINLYAASEEHHENNYNQNYNAAAGVAARAGKNGVALGVTAEGGEGKGYSHANSNRWRGSHIGDADSQTTLQSGEATTLSGSQAIGKGVQIQASALNIESLQDTSDYKGRQEYKGAGGTAGWGYHSGAMDYSRSKLQGDATLVNRQAGVYAGDDGFQIDVAGATKNRGGIITSSKAAEEAGLNRFNTATLELEDIENHRNLKGSSISTSLGYTDGMEQEGQLNRGLGGGHIRENAYDTSRASINTQNITIRDEVAQQALTGESVGDTIARANQGIHTEDSAQHGSALTAIDNGEKLQRQLEADAEITREFGKIAPRAINDIAESRGNLREYEQQQLAKATAEEALTRTSDPEKRAALQNYINERDSYLAANKANYDYWKEGGSGRNLLHGASTALMSGTPEGALAGYTTAALSPTLNKLDNPLLNTIGGAAIGAAMSGNNPAVIAGAANTDWHNRQLHPSEKAIIKDLAQKLAEENVDNLNYSEPEWQNILEITAAAMVDEENNQELNRELSRPAWHAEDVYHNEPKTLSLGPKYVYALMRARQILESEANKNVPISWKDGTTIKAYGEDVKRFQATIQQYQDHTLFGMGKLSIPIDDDLNDFGRYKKFPAGGVFGVNEANYIKEINDFSFKGTNIHVRKRMNQAYYDYTGTGEVEPVYPEFWLPTVKPIISGTGKVYSSIGSMVHDIRFAPRFATQKEISIAARRINEFKNLGNSKLRHSNIGYLEGKINGKNVDNKFWTSGPVNTKTEPQIFTPSVVEARSGRS